jgi:putative Mg2+ transporter-C (MgtC) family protein
MSVYLQWPDIALRLLLTSIAGLLIGFNRGSHVRAAGLRTTFLVSLAACVAMIQANLLLPTAGKAPTSFVSLDVMRLPLGILSGIGFIGAGAILRQENRVVGVTTAATLWFMTVVGLCFGGGQIILGVAATLLCEFALSCLKWVEDRIKQVRKATVSAIVSRDGPSDETIQADLTRAGFRVGPCSVAYSDNAQRRELSFTVRWQGRANETQVPPALRELASSAGVAKLAWNPDIG